MSSEARYQLSEKITDSAILVVRGDDYNEFTNALTAITQDQTFRADVEQFIAVASGKQPNMQQAIQNVQQVLPTQPPQTALGQYINPQQSVPPQQYVQQPPQQTTNDTFTCPHGQRTYKEGKTKNGGTWSAYFCPSKNCKPIGSDGKEWN